MKQIDLTEGETRLIRDCLKQKISDTATQPLFKETKMSDMSLNFIKQIMDLIGKIDAYDRDFNGVG